MRSRRLFLATIPIVALTTIVAAACAASPAVPAKSGEDARLSAVQSSNVASSPAVAAKPAATSAPAAPPRPAEAKPAEAEAGRGSSAGAVAAAPAPQAPAPPAAPPAPAPVPGQPGAAQALPVPPAPTPARPAEPAAVLPAQAGRKVIYTTELAVLVVSPSQLVGALSDLATGAGGYVAGVENKDEGGLPVTVVRLKLPPERYEAAMRQIRGLAVEVTSEKATTQDVTEEFNDVQTQLAALEASHAQLLELLKRAQTIEEILKIQEKVAQTKGQIDRLKGRETFLQRSAEFATVTVSARPAEDVMARTFGSLRSTLRRAEAQRAQTMAAIQRARTPEEEATLRDRLGEITLEIDRLAARLADVEGKAKAANITLPTPPADDPAVAATSDQDVVQEYLRLVGERRAAEAARDRLTREQRVQPSPELSTQLQQALVQVATLDARVKALEERARRSSIGLPNLTAEQIAALAGLPQEPWWSRFDWSPVALVGLFAALVVGLGVLLARRRRPPPGPVSPVGPAPSPAA